MGLKATKLVPRCFLVSENENQTRMVIDGYDLDMSYITDHILAMSFPADLMRAMYRKPLMEVKNVLESKHRAHYKVYNLCIEQDNDPFQFNNLVERYPYDDNHAPSLQMVKEFCESVHSWLSSDSKNIVLIHCMAGKGQIGLMICCYLVYLGMLVDEALQCYEDKWTKNNHGAMIPSQRRYVNYWKKSLTFLNDSPPEVYFPKPCNKELLQIRFNDTKRIETIYFVVSEMYEVAGQRYQSPVDVSRNFLKKIRNGGFRNSNSEIEEEEDEEAQKCLGYNFAKPLLVAGDLCVTFYEKMIGGRLFYACFNTAFIENNSIQFSILELDKVGNKGKAIAGPEFRVELLFGRRASLSF